MLHTETVEPSTLDLLKRLQRLPDLANTRLVGGTALALHLGHRKSVDLDMFGIFDPIVSYRKLLADAGYSVEGAENGTVQSLRKALPMLSRSKYTHGNNAGLLLSLGLKGLLLDKKICCFQRLLIRF